MILAGAEDRCTLMWDMSQSLSASGVQTYKVSSKKSLSFYDFFGGSDSLRYCLSHVYMSCLE